MVPWNGSTKLGCEWASHTRKRCHGRHYGSQGGRGAPDAARPRSRPSRQNALALVQSIVRLTRANTMEEYACSVEGRNPALSRAHTILSLSRWQGADIGGLVEDELGLTVLAIRRGSYDFWTQRFAATGRRAVHRFGAARAGDQWRQVWCAIRGSGARRARVELGHRNLACSLDGKPVDRGDGTCVARLWNADHQGECRRSNLAGVPCSTGWTATSSAFSLCR